MSFVSQQLPLSVRTGQSANINHNKAEINTKRGKESNTTANNKEREHRRGETWLAKTLR